ncbi:MAG: hypothetical protein ACOX4B_09575 [Bacillota bacterium]|jgi:hypothetical protein
MTDDMPKARLEAENKASDVMTEALRFHLDVLGKVDQVFDLICHLMGPDPMAWPPSIRVSMNLCCRLMDDLRSVELLCKHGYVVQARVMLTTVIEVACSIAHIAGNNEMAQEWIRHNDPERAFMSSRRLIRGVFDRLGIGSHVAEKMESLFRDAYRWGCQAKHANPVEQRAQRAVYYPNERALTLIYGPDYSAYGVDDAKDALTIAANAALVALMAIYDHIADSLDTRSLGELLALLALDIGCLTPRGEGAPE